MRRFSQKDYDQFNAHGIRVAAHFLMQKGYKVVDTTESYKSHDFVVEKDGKRLKIEAEVTRNWKSIAFPYPNMSVPFRKKDSKADLYIRCNAAGSALFCLPMSEVKSADLIVKDTCCTTGEMFFNLPVKNLTLYYYQDGAWYYDVVQGTPPPLEAVSANTGISPSRDAEISDPDSLTPTVTSSD